jgi:hypothetical protein
MRLGKEQATGVIEEPADVSGTPLDELRPGDAVEPRSFEERVEGTGRDALIRSR